MRDLARPWRRAVAMLRRRPAVPLTFTATTASAIIAAIALNAHAAVDQFGPICLRYYTPTQIQVGKGSPVTFTIKDFLPNARLDVSSWGMQWGDGAVDTLAPNPSYSLYPWSAPTTITHSYASSGIFYEQFDWVGGFYFPAAGGYRTPDGQPGTCDHETINIRVDVTSGTGGPPAAAVGDQTRADGNVGTTAFPFNVTLSHAAATSVRVAYATGDGSAIAPTDYQAKDGVLVFNPGETTKQVVVAVNADRRVKPIKTFHVRLSRPSGVTIAKADGVGTILNDDVAPAAHFKARVHNSGRVDLDASLSNPGSWGIAKYSWTFSDGGHLTTADPKTSYTFAHGLAGTVALVVADQYGNQSASASQPVDFCSDALPDDLADFAGLIRCVEAALPNESPREILSTIRKLYFGSESWSLPPRLQDWPAVIRCGLPVPDPRAKLGAKLYATLVASKASIQGEDVSHLFPGLEAMECPSHSVEIRRLGLGIKTVHMPNYLFATWGGDIGSAAALKAYDEKHRVAQPWPHYIGPNGIRAGDDDLNGDIDAIVLAYALGGRSCSDQPGPFVLTEPLSKVIADYASTASNPLSAYRKSRIGCLTQILGVAASSARVDAGALALRYHPMVFDFAKAYYFVQDGGSEVFSNASVYERVRERAATVTQIFADWLARQP